MVGRALLDLFYPPQCAVCGDPADGPEERFCAKCVPLLAADRAAPSCPTCAASAGPHTLVGGRCAQCRERRTKLHGAVRAGEYGPVMGNLVRQYKYHGRATLGALLGGCVAEAVQAAPWRGRVEALVYVPTHWRHRLRRRMHAAEELARLVGPTVGLPVVGALRRVRAGPHQVGMSYTRRLENVHGAFAVRPEVTLCDTRLLLMDDVRTTGATLEECTRVLLGAGAGEVYAAVVVAAAWPGPGTLPPPGL